MNDKEKNAVNGNDRLLKPISTPMKLGVTLVIGMPQAYLIWANKAWQINLITLLATISILIFWNFDKIGELTIKKDEVSIKVRQAVNEMYASLDSVKEVAAPLFLQNIENQFFKGFYFVDEVERVVTYYDKYYRENVEVELAMKKFKQRSLKRYLTDIDNSATMRSSEYTDDQIRQILPKLVNDWKEKYGNTIEDSTSFPRDTLLYKYEHVVEAKDGIEKLLNLYQKYDI